jgi:hypothetical protein
MTSRQNQPTMAVVFEPGGQPALPVAINARISYEIN